MKKLIAAVLTALALTACGAEISNSPAPTTTTEKSNRQSYVEAMQKEAPRWTADQSLLLGQNACDAYDRGAKVEDLLNEAYEHSLNVDLMAAVLTYSAIYLCPEHKDSVGAQLKELAGV